MGSWLVKLAKLVTTFLLCGTAMGLSENPWAGQTSPRASKPVTRYTHMDSLLKEVNLPVLHEQEDIICCEDITLDPSWSNDDAFMQLMGLGETPTCMPCVFDVEKFKNSPQCKAMVSSSAKIVETLDKAIKLFYDTGASHTSTPYKQDFVTLDETAREGTLDGIASGLEIKGTGTV